MPTELTFTVGQDPGDRGYFASAHFVDGGASYSVVTQGDTFEELREMVREAVTLTCEEIGPPTTLHFKFTEPFRASTPHLP
ncbi:MAG: hypothetical protein EXR66_04425 [Dehalococcoidia bacterium]|nr:hypothetical protein [Dehalococcoidia bacterium]